MRRKLMSFAAITAEPAFRCAVKALVMNSNPWSLQNTEPFAGIVMRILAFLRRVHIQTFGVSVPERRVIRDADLGRMFVLV